MPTKIKRGQSLLIPFKNGMTIYDSQNKPRMYLTQKAFEKSFPGHLIDREGVELVEYAEVVRCKDCMHSNHVVIDDDPAETFEVDVCLHKDLFPTRVTPDFYCAHGKRKMDVEVEG